MVFPRVIQNDVDTSEKIKAPKDTVAAGLSNIGESINVESVKRYGDVHGHGYIFIGAFHIMDFLDGLMMLVKEKY